MRQHHLFNALCVQFSKSLFSQASQYLYKISPPFISVAWFAPVAQHCIVLFWWLFQISLLRLSWLLYNQLIFPAECFLSPSLQAYLNLSAASQPLTVTTFLNLAIHLSHSLPPWCISRTISGLLFRDIFHCTHCWMECTSTAQFSHLVWYQFRPRCKYFRMWLWSQLCVLISHSRNPTVYATCNHWYHRLNARPTPTVQSSHFILFNCTCILPQCVLHRILMQCKN